MSKYKPFKSTKKCKYCPRMLGKFQEGDAHPKCTDAKHPKHQSSLKFLASRGELHLTIAGGKFKV